jgi:chromosome segregation ATPase
MIYKLHKINTIAACEALLVSAQKKKQTLERKADNLAASINTFRERMEHVSKEIDTVQTLLKAYTKAYNSLHEESKDKASMNIKIKRIELRQARVEKKALTYSLRTLLAKELKYNVLLNQVSTADAYIVAIQNRIAALNNPGPVEATPAVLPLLPIHSKIKVRKRVYKMFAKFAALSQNQNLSAGQKKTEPLKKRLISNDTLNELGIGFLNGGIEHNN